MRNDPSRSRRTAVLPVVLALVVATPLTSGCLSEEEPVDMDGWYLSMTLESFDPDGPHPQNTTRLRFDVRLGGLREEGWRLQQSGGFTKGENDSFPVRVHARYEEREGSSEDFPIIGPDSVLTGDLAVVDGEMELVLDGDPGLITIGELDSRRPNQIGLTATVRGDRGELLMIFKLAEPLFV